MGFSFKKQNRSAFENLLRTKYEMFTEIVKVSMLPYYCFADSGSMMVSEFSTVWREEEDTLE